jgi:hypothetical protein
VFGEHERRWWPGWRGASGQQRQVPAGWVGIRGVESRSTSVGVGPSTVVDALLWWVPVGVWSDVCHRLWLWPTPAAPGSMTMSAFLFSLRARPGLLLVLLRPAVPASRGPRWWTGGNWKQRRALVNASVSAQCLSPPSSADWQRPAGYWPPECCQSSAVSLKGTCYSTTTRTVYNPSQGMTAHACGEYTKRKERKLDHLTSRFAQCSDISLCSMFVSDSSFICRSWGTTCLV